MNIIQTLSSAGVHERAIKRHFDNRVVYDGPVVFDHPLYCIGFYNRTGSNLLAGYLRDTPYFSGFHEQLNFNAVEKKSSDWGVDSFPEFIKQATIKGKGNKSAYGFKASVDQLMMLCRFQIPQMYKGGLRIIHITRRDLIGQAVSFQIASQTKQWSSEQKVTEPVQVKFDATQITNLISGAQKSMNAIAMCPSSYKVGLQRGLSIGGSGSFV